MRLDEGERGPAAAALVGALSPTALLFAGALTGTGLFAAFGTGAYSWLRVKPALGGERAAGRLRRSVTVEVGVGVLVLLVTAVLVATAPPGGMR